MDHRLPIDDRHVRKLIITLLFLLALGLRLFQVASESYWIDELVSIHFSSHPLWQALLWDNHPPTYHFLLKLWISLFGNSEFATRSLSVLFSMTTVYLVGRAGASQRGALNLWAMALQAVNPLSIQMAQEARPYALFEMASAFQMIYFLRVFKGNSLRRDFFSWTLTTILACGVHYLGFVLSMIQLLFLIIKRSFPKELRITFPILLGLALFIYISHFQWWPLHWQSLKFAAGDLPASLLQLLILLSHHGLSVLVLTVLFMTDKKVFKNSNIVMSLLTGVLFILTILVLSLVLQRDLFLPRYFVGLVPFFSVALGFTFTHFATDRKKTALLVTSVVIFSWPLSEIYLPRKAPWRSAAQFIENAGGHTVLTTRTLAIETPYFKKFDAQVLKLDLTTNPTHTVEKLLQEEAAIYIIDNYWGSVAYISRLKEDLEKEGITIEQRDFRKGESDLVSVFVIKKAPEHPDKVYP